MALHQMVFSLKPHRHMKWHKVTYTKALNCILPIDSLSISW